MGASRFKLLIASVLCGLVVIGIPGSGSAVASATPEAMIDFCTPHLVRDYTAPFSRLPTVHEMPKAKPDDRYQQAFGVPLPFGPSALHIYRALGVDRYGNSLTQDVSPVLAEGGEYGYIFSNQKDHGALHLDWTVKAQLMLLNTRGRANRLVDSKVFAFSRIARRAERRILFRIPSRVGIYRLDIQFANRFKRTLGHFSEYVRVVRPRVDVRLAVNGSSFRRGEVVATRIEDIGTATVVSTVGFEVERLSGSVWSQIPVSQGWELYSSFGWEPYRSFARVGWSSNCSSIFEIPPEFQAGRYRVVKGVQVGTGPKNRQSFDLMADFDVTE